jgi:pyruvate kinase
MDKKAKILATLGPAIFKKNIINNLIRSGVDGFRINFSHNLTGIEKIVKIIRLQVVCAYGNIFIVQSKPHIVI